MGVVEGQGRGGRVVGREEATRGEGGMGAEEGRKRSGGKEGGNCGVRFSEYPTV